MNNCKILYFLEGGRTVNYKILIVEDLVIIANDLKLLLENMGYIVTGISSNGKEAIEKIEEIKPDLILMDIILKGDLDGIETVQQIHDLQDIPIIYLTAYNDKKLLERAKMTKHSKFIIKPYDETELRTAIENALK